MPKDQAYLAYLHELLEPLGKISSKILFGGYGIYCNDVIMGLVIDEAFYMKVDLQTQSFFKDAGSEAFVYQMKSKKIAMNYWSAPNDAMESAEQMLPWAKHAYEAALRKAQTTPVKKKAKKA